MLIKKIAQFALRSLRCLETGTMNEVGTTLLNSLTNSTFDIGNMAKTLAEAEVAGPRSIVERNQDKASTELDALNYLRLNLEAFNSYVTDLSNPETFSQKTATSSDENAVSVAITGNVTESNYQIESRQLAQYHTQVVNKAYSSPYDVVSNGTLDIEVGGEVQSITVDGSNNSLQGLKEYINAGDFGVTASVINNAGSYQLMFTSKQQGAAGEVTVSGLPDFDNAGYTTTSEAQDAIMVVNGLEVANNSNTFDEVIEGVSFTLNSAVAGQNNNVAISNDSEGAVESIQTFVEIYNQLHTIKEELSSYDTSELTEEQLESEEYQFYGDLAGNSTLKQAVSQIDQAMIGVIEEIPGNFNSLISIGISKNLDGELELDEEVLNGVVDDNFDALKSLFSTGGSSEDNLINVLDGSDKTITGTYQLEVTQLAERALVTSGLATFDATGDEKVAGNRINNAETSLQIETGAQLNMLLDGVNSAPVNLTAGNFATKDDVATQIQSDIDAALGAGVVSFFYDTKQARFEIEALAGNTLDVADTSVGLDNQGFITGNVYEGESVINLSAAPVNFEIAVDDSDPATITLGAERYTHSELASAMANAINNNSTIKESGNSVSVSSDGSAFSIASTRFGGFSEIDITAVSAGMANSGLAIASDQGQNVDGTITTATGTLNIGAYADSQDGRIISISDFAVINGEAAEVQGLKFQVLGGAYDVGNNLITDRGDLSFAKGFGTRLEEAISGLFDEDTGVIERRVNTLGEKLEEYSEKNEDIDTRYALLEQKYQMQFAMLQSILSQAEATRNQLSAQFSSNN